MFKKLLLFPILMLMLSSICHASYKKPRKLKKFKKSNTDSILLFDSNCKIKKYCGFRNGYIKSDRKKYKKASSCSQLKPLKGRTRIVFWHKRISNKLCKLFGPKRREFEERRDTIFADSFGNNASVWSAFYSGKDINGHLQEAKKLFDDISDMVSRVQDMRASVAIRKNKKCISNSFKKVKIGLYIPGINNFCNLIKTDVFKKISKIRNILPELKDYKAELMKFYKKQGNYKAVERISSANIAFFESESRRFQEDLDIIVKAKRSFSVKSINTYLKRMEKLKNRVEYLLVYVNSWFKKFRSQSCLLEIKKPNKHHKWKKI